MVLLVSPPLFSFLLPFLFAFLFATPRATACLRQAINTNLSLWSYGFPVCLAPLPCAAIGGIVGIAFQVVVYMKSINKREYQIAIRVWQDPKQTGRMNLEDFWLKASQSVMLGAMIFGGWTALWIGQS